ncbi:MAG: hypothetical protein MJK04_09300, partial [Psychrosphaera sp.]|nr:hypothetical protein [Psychrosphaera sp.]
QAVFQASFSTKDGWQTAQTMTLEYGELIAAEALTRFTNHQVRLTARMGNKAAFDKLVVGQYIMMPPEFAFEIEQIDAARVELSLKPRVYKEPVESPRLLRNFSVAQQVAAIQSELNFDAASGVLSANEESFSPEHTGRFVVDSLGQVYRLQSFIDANQMIAKALVQLPIDAPSEQKNAVFKQLLSHYDDAVSLQSISLRSATVINPTIEFKVAANQLKITCPQGSQSEDVVKQWQHLLDTRAIDPGRFELLLTEAGNTALLAERDFALPEQDNWLKRYESLDSTGLRVTYQGRAGDSANITIAPYSLNRHSEFSLVGNELIIRPGFLTCTANEVAAQWRIWQDNNATRGFDVTSQDKRLWPLNEVSEAYFDQQDLQDKGTSFTDVLGNGFSVHCVCPAATDGGFVLSE